MLFPTCSLFYAFEQNICLALRAFCLTMMIHGFHHVSLLGYGTELGLAPASIIYIHSNQDRRALMSHISVTPPARIISLAMLTHLLRVMLTTLRAWT